MENQKIKILINTAHQRFGGAVQVALSFLLECRNFNEYDYYVCVGPGVKKSLREDDFPDSFTFEYFDFGVISFRTTFEINRTLRELEARVSPDVVISTSGPTYFHSRAPQIIGFNLPLYIYPESPYLQFLKRFDRVKFFLKKYLHFYFFKRDASYYVVQTDDVNIRVRKALKTEKVLTVSNTASSYYVKWQKYPDKLPKKSDNIFRFVTISSYYTHKNLEIIPDVLSILKKRGINNVEFVLTIRQEDFMSHLGYSKGIHNVGPIHPKECPSLYQECDAMFMPTLAECFSASYPEAMIMDKPIVTTDLGFARSICGKAALYFKAKDAEEAADQIKRLLDDKELEATLIAQGHKELKKFDSPQERASKYIELCASIAKEQS